MLDAAQTEHGSIHTGYELEHKQQSSPILLLQNSHLSWIVIMVLIACVSRHQKKLQLHVIIANGARMPNMMLHFFVGMCFVCVLTTGRTSRRWAETINKLLASIRFYVRNTNYVSVVKSLKGNCVCVGIEAADGGNHFYLIRNTRERFIAIVAMRMCHRVQFIIFVEMLFFFSFLVHCFDTLTKLTFKSSSGKMGKKY